MTPYSTGAVTKKKRGGGANTDDYDLLDNEEEGSGAVNEEEEEGDDLETDTMIKVGIRFCLVMLCKEVTKIDIYALPLTDGGVRPYIGTYPCPIILTS